MSRNSGQQANGDAVLLSQQAGRLLGVPQRPVAARPQAANIARAAAPLLGLASASAKDVPSPPLSAFARQRSATPVAKPEGVVARLRKLFGKS